ISFHSTERERDRDRETETERERDIDTYTPTTTYKHKIVYGPDRETLPPPGGISETYLVSKGDT
ncbi:MAG: hypothetical protein AAFP87_21215, partial [Pseudomonadota bacterium]